MTKDRTSFDWNPQFPSERTTLEAPSLWRFFLLLLVIECLALVLVVPELPKSGSIPWEKVVHEAVAAPFLCWMALSHIVYWITYDIPATEDAEHNLARWRQIKVWQHQNRWGTVVLDSVILTPEPDLAERMLKLEGDPPENPGKVMALGSIEAANDGSRLGRLLDALLTPLVPALAQAAKGGLLDIVMQCDHEALCSEVISAWARLALPGKPVVRWLEHSRDVGFADTWFEDELKPDNWRTRDKAPRYRLLLAWHLNKAGPDAIHKDSEAAVAMLLGMPLLMYEKPEIKHQAWLFRQITGDADQAESLLASLLKAEQVPSKRIRHFWHSGLKGMTQHATLGAIRDSGLKLEAHALDPAIGPQAPVTRWVTQALLRRWRISAKGHN